MKKSVESTLDALETGIGAVFFLCMFGAILVQVFFRYVLNAPLVWPFEFSIYCYIYVVYIGAVMAARRDSHVVFDLVYGCFPRRLRLAVGALTNMFIAGVFLYTIPSSISYIRLIGDIPSASLGLPWGVVLAVFPVGMGLMALILCVRGLFNLRGLITGEVH